MKILLGGLLIQALTAASALATAQFADQMIYEGETYSLHTNPMEAFFREHPEKRPTDGLRSTALWRGYIATFEIDDGRLILNDLEIKVRSETYESDRKTEWESVKDRIVAEGEALAIDWFTGILVLPHGEVVNYVHMGYGSTYSEYILLKIENGVFKGRKDLVGETYDEFRERQFEAYRQTDAYWQEVAELKEQGWAEETIDSFLKEFIIEYTSVFVDDEASLDEDPVERDGGQE